MLDMQAISNGLRLGPDGVWHAKDSQEISYPSAGHDLFFSVEDRSFWFRHRNSCILSVVRSYPPEDGGAIFDIGGGNGFVSRALDTAGFTVALVEPGLSGALNAKRRGLENVICATTATAQLKPNSLPAVGLFDVIEHIDDDLAFLQSLNALVRDHGRVYVTVPAYSTLWSAEDVSAGHFRRYTRRALNELMDRAGFEVEFSSYIFRFLPIPIALLRALPYRLGLSPAKGSSEGVARDHAAQGGVMARIVARLLDSEVKNLETDRPMSFGGSCLLVAKKRPA